MIKQFGLIGYPLSHSFSKKYFAEKFKKETITDVRYDLFEIEKIEMVEEIFKIPQLKGFNVTIPYKESIKEYLDDFDVSAKNVGAVNVVKIDPNGQRIGFNSDYYGFRQSLNNWLDINRKFQALILGTGGAAKAIIAVLTDLKVDFQIVSRDPHKGDLTYEMLNKFPEKLENYKLIINTTPLGMSPNLNLCPDLPYQMLGKKHYLYDLIYNPPETLFLKKGSENGCQIKNGSEMLELQAEKSWEIWNS